MGESVPTTDPAKLRIAATYDAAVRASVVSVQTDIIYSVAAKPFV